METKQIIAIVGACVLVCILTAIVNLIRGNTENHPEESSEPEVQVTSVTEEEIDFWESVRRQQTTTVTTTVVTDEAGNIVTRNPAAVDDSETVDVNGNAITAPVYGTNLTSEEILFGENASTETESPLTMGQPFEG